MKAFQIPDSLSLAVTARVLECWQILRDRNRIAPDAPIPDIRFYTGRAAAGLAHTREHWIGINGPLLIANTAAMLRQTVAHEVAHIAAQGIYSIAARGNRRPKSHGPEWAHVMRLLGVSPDRCHNFDLAAAGVKVRRLPRALYACNCRTHQITLARVRKIARGTIYRCMSCRAPIAPAKS